MLKCDDDGCGVKLPQNIYIAVIICQSKFTSVGSKFFTTNVRQNRRCSELSEGQVCLELAHGELAGAHEDENGMFGTAMISNEAF